MLKTAFSLLFWSYVFLQTVVLGDSEPLYRKLGRHLIIEMQGVQFDQLNSIVLMENYFRTACKRGNLTLLDINMHEFQPHGVSGVAVLAESHISVHTWPEYGYAALDIFTCGDTADPEAALMSLKDQLGSSKMKVTRLDRGLPAAPEDRQAVRTDEL